VYAGVPIQAGLQLAKPAMLDFASGSVDQAPERVGPYEVFWAGRLPGGEVRFAIAGAGDSEYKSGFVYSPRGEPQSGGHGTYKHLSGPWYTWVAG
jgi:hypothetical protein